MTDRVSRDPFPLAGVVHLVRPLRREARDLEELRLGIAEASVTSLFYHALQPLLRFAEATEQPPDDFSHWVHGVVQDRETAERMAFALQTCGDSPEMLREGLLEVLSPMSEATRRRRDAPEDGAFVFLDVDSVRVPTTHVVDFPSALIERIEQLPLAVLFYHAVEQRWLDPTAPSLADWLEAHGEPKLAEKMAGTLQSGKSLIDVRRMLIRQYRQSRLGRRLADAALASDDMRREEGRRAMRHLARRLTTPRDGGPQRAERPASPDVGAERRVEPDSPGFDPGRREEGAR
jgi:Family of unknown function (DUF5752)